MGSLSSISKSFNNTIISSWSNSKVGSIIPARYILAYRFVEYNNIDGQIFEIHTSDEAKDQCPIVAEGIVAYWLLKGYNDQDINLFKNYYDFSFAQYQKECAKDVNMLGKDLKLTFLTSDHLNKERKYIQASNAIFDFLPLEDQNTISALTQSYKEYVLKKLIDYKVEKSGSKTPLFERFCMFYRQFKIACQAAEWVEHKYDLGCMPYKKEMSEKWIRYYEVELPEIINDWTSCFDSNMPTNVDSGLKEEIYEQFTNCRNDDERWRLAQDFILPFKEFARHFIHREEENNIKQSIEMFDKELQQIKDGADNSKLKQYRLDQEHDIERLKFREKEFYNIVQNALTTEQDESHSVELCLAIYWSALISFARKLAAILLRFKIDIKSVEAECEVYLLYRYLTSDYIDCQYVSSCKHARSLLSKCEQSSSELESKELKRKMENNKNVFIVHGRDELCVAEVENFLLKLGFIPVVLKEQSDGGRTIIEKFEDYTNVSFAIVLYNPCDFGYLQADGQNKGKPRARQNVIFEHGYLVGKLGREHVCALVNDPEIEIPSDLSGILYKTMDKEGSWKIEIAKEMKTVGLDVNLNNLI